MKKIKTRHLLIGAIFVVGMLVLMITALIANQQKKVYRSRATYPTVTPIPPCSGFCLPNGEDCTELGIGSCPAGKFCCQDNVPTRTPTPQATRTPTPRPATGTPIPPSHTPTPVPECIFHETGNYRCSPIDYSWGTEYIYNVPFVPSGCKTTNPTPPATFWGYTAPNDPRCLTSPTPTTGQGGPPTSTPTQPPPPPPATKTPTPRVTVQPTPTSGTEPSATAVPPTATPNPSCTRKNEGDANCDGVIDGFDYSIWLNSQCFIYGGGQQCSDLRADFNSDGNVDDDDYLIWFNHRYT